MKMIEEEKKISADDALLQAAPPSRRLWMYGAVGAVAALAGAGFAWRRFEPHAVSDPALAAIWSLNFDTPEGGSLSLASFRRKPLILNFWATWCPPCVEELPLLDAFYRQNNKNGWQIIGLAVDQPTSVRNWLQKKPLSFPVGLAGLDGTELGKSLGNAAGGLPFTVILGADGALIQRKMGKLEPEDLQRLVG